MSVSWLLALGSCVEFLEVRWSLCFYGIQDGLTDIGPSGANKRNSGVVNCTYSVSRLIIGDMLRC